MGLIYDNLLKLGVDVQLVNTNQYFTPSLFNRVMSRFFIASGLLPTPIYFGSGIKKLNNIIVEKARVGKFGFILFMKPILIYPSTVVELKKFAKLISWYPDHVDFTKSGSTYFYKSIPLYDCHLAAISANVEPLLRWGAKRAIYLTVSADASCHHPVLITEGDRKKLGADVVFIGTYAKENRSEYLEKLCRDGYDIKIYGNSWGRLPWNSCLRRKNRIVPGGVYCEDMARVLGASKIALAFMRKHNQEYVACRSWEIPLCGGFMLHERTEEAEKMLLAGKETDFFDSYEEMKEKIDYYLKHPELRERIAKAGRERILNGGELLDSIVKKLLEILMNEFGIK